MQKTITEISAQALPAGPQGDEQTIAIPDIKLSHSGYLIYANARGIDFLRKVSESKKTSSVGFLVSEFPMILIPGCQTTLRLDIGEDVYDLRVAAYRINNQVGLFVSKRMHEPVTGKASHSS